MKIKKLVSALAAISMLPISAFAANTINVGTVDLVNKKVTVSGVLESEKTEDVMIIVAKPNVNLANIASDTDKIIYQKETEAKDGVFSFEVPLGTLADETGDYAVYIKAESGNTEVRSFSYATVTAQQAAVTAISGQDAAEIEANLDDYIDIFGLDNLEAYDGATKSEIAKKLDDTVTSSTTPEKVQEIITESAILSCYNNSKEEYIVDASNNIKNDELIGLTALGTGTSFYSVYNSTLSVDGQEAIIDSLQGQGFTSYSDIKAAFMESVLLNGIANGKEFGAGHISELLTAANAAALGNVNLTNAINTYLANSAVQNQANSNLLNAAKATGFADLDALATGITTAVTAALGSAGGTVTTVITGNNNSTSGAVGPGASSAADSSSAGSAAESTSQGNGTFSDIASNHWANSDIMALYREGVVSGYPDGTYRPNGLITREQAVKMLCEAFDVYGSGAAVSFSDVAEGAWYAHYVSAGVEKNIIKGINSSLFGVGRYITRQDLAVIIYRIAGEPEIEWSAEFSDFDTVSPYAKNAVLYLNWLGILSGYPDGTIRPLKNVTRAEAAKIINGCIKEGI